MLAVQFDRCTCAGFDGMGKPFVAGHCSACGHLLEEHPLGGECEAILHVYWAPFDEEDHAR